MIVSHVSDEGIGSRNVVSVWMSLRYLITFLVQVRLRQNFDAPQVRPDQSSGAWPLDHDSVFRVPKMPGVTNQPSGTFKNTWSP